jgi:hypothetical protein
VNALRRRDFLLTGVVPLLGLGSPGAGSTSCILLLLTGGPSHLDTWDMKPDAPSEVRGPFRPIRTNVPGIEISEIFPRMARQAHRYTLIRSVHHTAPPSHNSALETMLTGLPESILNRDRERADDVQLRAKYGWNRFGQSCFHARHLIESGVRFVTVSMFDTVFDEMTWDIHGWRPFSPISCYRDVVGPMYDSAYSALLDDLSDRGLLGSTLVVSMGEFGRTPKINPSGGRDHWPHCFTIQMAGGGIRGGQIYGSSDATGAAPRDQPVSPANVVATINKALGIPPDAEPLRELFL